MSDVPDFKGKRVWLYASTGGRGSGTSGVILDSPEFQLQAGRWFLVGDMDFTKSDPKLRSVDPPATAAIAWEHVVYYFSKQL